VECPHARHSLDDRFVLRLTGSLGSLFGALAIALVVDGLTLAAAVASGVWFRRLWRTCAHRSPIRMLIGNEMRLGGG
jgi:hypothetical protein